MTFLLLVGKPFWKKKCEAIHKKKVNFVFKKLIAGEGILSNVKKHIIICLSIL